MSDMTTGTAEVGARTPSDSEFGARLAMVRHLMRWNVKEAARECGVPAASWRYWEDGAEPRNLVPIAMVVAARANVDIDWLVYGQAKRHMQPPTTGGKLNVDYPLRRDPLAPKVLPRRVGADAKPPAHGDFRRKPNGRSTSSDSRPDRPHRTVSSANYTAQIARGSVA